MKQISKRTLIKYTYVLSQFGENATREDENKELRKALWTGSQSTKMEWLNDSSQRKGKQRALPAERGKSRMSYM